MIELRRRLSLGQVSFILAFNLLSMQSAVATCWAALQVATDRTEETSARRKFAAIIQIGEPPLEAQPAPSRSYCRDDSGKPTKAPRAPRLTGLVRVGEARSALLVFEDGSSGWMRVGWETWDWTLIDIADQFVTMRWCGVTASAKLGEPIAAETQQTKEAFPKIVEATQEVSAGRADLQKAFTQSQDR